MHGVTALPFDPGAAAKAARPANVRATDSAAPEVYAPLPSAPSDIYTHRSHAAQYGAGRRYGITIRALILHTTEGESFFGSLGYNTWRPQTVSSSAHAGPNGELGYEIRDGDRPWTTGRWNDESLTLEIVGRAAWTAAQWRARPKQLEAVTRWLVDNAARHGIPAVWLSPAEFAEGASRANQSPLRAGRRRGIIDHHGANAAAISLGHDNDKYSHWDIGPGLREVVINDIIPEVARRLGFDPTPPTLIPGGTVLHTCEPHQRLIDTRTGGVPITTNDVVEVPIPYPDAKTAIVNVTVVAPTAHGYVSVTGKVFGEASTGNFAPGVTEANACIAAVVDRTISIRLGGAKANPPTAHLIVDLQGYVD